MGRLLVDAHGIVAKISWYWSSLMGDNHYARYLEHHRRTHAGEPALSERDYWKARHRTADLNPQGRCC